MTELLAPLSAGTRRGTLLHALGMHPTMAFQPIVDVNAKSVFGYEALARGPRNEDAAHVLASIDNTRLGDFDRACTRTAIRLASLLMVPSRLSINLATTASPDKLLSFASQLAALNGFSHPQLMFEISQAGDPDHTLSERQQFFTACRRLGFATAIDHFGTTASGLSLLSTLKPDAVKLAMTLVRDIHTDPVRLSTVRGITQMCSDRGILVIAVGVEIADECRALRDAGVYLCQGNCFAPPRLEGLPAIPSTVWPRVDRRSTPRTFPFHHKPTTRIHLR